MCYSYVIELFCPLYSLLQLNDPDGIFKTILIVRIDCVLLSLLLVVVVGGSFLELGVTPNHTGERLGVSEYELNKSDSHSCCIKSQGQLFKQTRQLTGSNDCI